MSHLQGGEEGKGERKGPFTLLYETKLIQLHENVCVTLDRLNVR